ncbi:aminoglycoside phosphotransferase family protein [Actinoplanes sp. NBRC 101535]|uniref:aminoglycoside phosphotransferase family protein n=1 Tax=Actinoplanes sp. NBRC 101535 TaxID=3032196 RepID=UPI00249FD4C7|nr:aminoglycoside phosphotransferase family protein [Actinoplanes sp. NBRC 101535]GLX99667.1 hypothetical protein Acsp01_00470 [Actinoplanes sp. NBRC 101535]
MGQSTPAVLALLRHLEKVGFDGAPRVDARLPALTAHGPLAAPLPMIGGELRLPGEPVGDIRPWPHWTYHDETLWQVAQWLREYHTAVAGFVPPADAIWRDGGTWEPGLIIGHNNAAPYNASWSSGRITGFSGWDFAGPVTPTADLALIAYAWVPLTARSSAQAAGFTAFEDRPRRLRLLLNAYRWSGTLRDFIHEVRDRMSAAIHDIRRLSAAGDAGCQSLIATGVDKALAAGVQELATFPS